VRSIFHSTGPQKLAAQPHEARELLPRGRAQEGGTGTPPPQRIFPDLRGGAFTVLNCELARFAKCSEQLREATYLAKSTPFTKKWSSHLLIHTALLLLPSPPPLLPPPPFLLPPFCTPSSLPLISPLSKTVLPSVAQKVKRSAGVSWSALVVLLGVVLEVAQLLIGGKHPELRDSVLVDQHLASLCR
jgi:hypothetical protein